ncbi:MAG: sterol desaturase [Bacteroidetes bacterium]|nr:MAG: sterol desaturase [Bacteroidota bacterium]
MLNLIALLIPVFLLLVLAEWYVSYKRQDNRYAAGNTVMNLAIGAIDQVCSLFYFALLYLVMDYVYNHFRFIELQNNWKQWVIAYIAVDFLSYWYHRLSHRVNILWAGHVTHHSSEYFNFSNGFRTSFFQGINRVLFWAFLPVFGFDPLVLVIILKVSGIYDFLLHTEYIPKLGFLEKILITPSLHRVHHGKNEIYIDKNYGSTFLIWDQVFGTYQEETETVRYGIKSPYTDNNPFVAIGHHYQYLWKSVKAARSWPDKIKILFMPPEWKPENSSLPGLPALQSYIPASSYVKRYAFFQIICCAVSLIAMLVVKNFLSNPEIMLCSGIIVMSMANCAMIYNGNIRSDFARRESARLVFGLLLICLVMFIYSSIFLAPLLFFFLGSLILIRDRRMQEDEAEDEDGECIDPHSAN